ncbi:hypothetical protein [Streptomyces sp. KR80]|uniref:hypothetical protein n=1 Tax=Streptomyces sp. KR80 TaxID=3457426 RepID=UPI003FD4AB25
MGEGEAGPYWDETTKRWVMGTAAPPDPYGPGPRPTRTWVPPTARTRIAVLLAVAAVLGGGAGFGTWALLRDSGDGDPADARPGTSVGALPTESGSPSGPDAGYVDPSPTAEADAPPDGFRRVQDPDGFTLDVPVGWQRSEDETGVFYRSADESGLIQVFHLDGPEETPYQALEEAERFLKRNRDYERLRLERMGQGESADAELEYSYTSDKAGGPRRVLDRVLTAADAEMYAVLVAGPAEDWPEQQEVQRVVLDAFCPAGHCPASGDVTP